jgi:hypothetical protein
MSFLFAVIENILVIIALPWLVNDATRDFVARVDNRGMFSIPFCRSLAVACGGVLAIATGVLAGFTNELSLANLWDISGSWHEGRFLITLARYTEELWSLSQGAILPDHVVFAEILLTSAAILTAVNFGIALMGWRSLGALRGLITHILISISVWFVLTLGALVSLWVLHWLNFWIFLVLFIVVEMRRREVVATRLSF